MKRQIKVDPFLKRQPQKLFVEELKKPVHSEKPQGFNTRAVEKGEVNVSGVYLVVEYKDELLETAYADFNNFLNVYEIAGDKYPVITRRGATAKFESYKIVTDKEKTVLIANDTEGIRRGLVYIEDEMRRRGGAFLKEGKTERMPWLVSRITHCFFAPTNRPPNNGEELGDDVDYYPEEYLNRLAHDGSNGVWIYTRFPDLLPSNIITEYGKDYKRRIDKLNRTIEKCARYGVKVFVFAIEPVPLRGDLYEKYADMRGNQAWDGYTFCANSERGKAYCKESVQTLFELCPELGGVMLITNGERTTNCASGYEYIKRNMSVCPNCKDKRAGEILAQAVDSLIAGMKERKPQAEFLSWTYGHREWEIDDIEEYVRLIDKDAVMVQGFEDNGREIQLGKERLAIDYWLSYVGPSEMFKKTALAAKKYGKKLYTKIQACCSHDVASVPYVPVPGILFEKYKAMNELGVSGVVQCWYFGNYPSLMNKAAGEFAFWSDFDDKNGFLEFLAGIYWGKEKAKEVVKAWNLFEKGYKNYPVNIMFSYYGPMHDGPVWQLQLLPKNFSLARTWLYGDPMDGDRINEAILSGHTLEEAVILTRLVSKYWKEGRKIMDSIPAELAMETEQKSVVAALDCQFESGADILEFYLLRDKLGNKQGDPKAIFDSMEEIVKKEMQISRRLAKISADDCRLGYHSEAEGFRYFPEKLEDRVKKLEVLLKTEFKEVRERIEKGLSPLEYYDGVEPDCKRYKLGGDWENFYEPTEQVRLYEDEKDIVIEYRSKREMGIAVSPEFKLFEFNPPVYIRANGKVEIERRVWQYFAMLPEAIKAEIEKYSVRMLSPTEEFPGTHLEVRLDKKKFGVTEKPIKISIRTLDENYWCNTEDKVVYLGKYDIHPETFVWLNR